MKLQKDDLLLYAITDRKWLKGETLENQVECALCGGVTMVQLREKTLPYSEFYEGALKLQNLCKVYQVPFIIDDNVELVRCINADGVHIGQGDCTLKKARKILGEEMIIGVSVNNVDQAVRAEKDGADYLRYSAVYTSDTRTNVSPIGLENLSKICSNVSIPVIAAGGITEEKIINFYGTGIAGIAVTSAIFAQDDIKNAARRLKKKVLEVIP